MPPRYDVPFRDTFWNVPPWAQFLLYALSLVAIGVFALGLWQRVLLWREGKPESRWDRIPERVALVVRHGLLQGRTLSQRYPGIMHALIFWGFCVLFLGTVLATLDYDIAVLLFDAKLLKGPFYLVYELSLDAFGLFFVLGLGVALYRRFVQRPKRIDPTPHFAMILTLLLVINVTGFVVEACRLAVVQPWWGPWSFAGWWLGQGFLAAGLGEGGLRALHLGTWIFHFAVSFAFIAIIPHSYFIHLITTPLNIFFSRLRPQGELLPIPNIEEAESLGVSKLEEFSWKRRLDFDACTMCGRCQAACPAYLAGTPLNPKQIILKLRGLMHHPDGKAIHGETIAAEELWACTTCNACVEVCPAFIEIVDTIVDLRRYLALSEGALPSTAGTSLQNMQRAGNPWGLSPADRLAWAEGLDVPRLAEGPGGRVPVLGGLLGLLRPAQPADRPRGGEDPPGRRRLLRGDGRGEVQRRRRPASRRGVHLPDARHRERREPPALPLPQGDHRLPALLQHHRERVQAVRGRRSRCATTRWSSPSSCARAGSGSPGRARNC